MLYIMKANICKYICIGYILYIGSKMDNRSTRNIAVDILMNGRN